MRYHLAARYARRVELCKYREQLLSIGDTVMSRWLDFGKKPKWSSGIARADCEDLIAAQTVIIFTERPNTILATGGHHVEFGLALAQNKAVIVVGPRENVFHYLLPDSQMFATWNEAFATIKRCALLQTRSVRKLNDFKHRDNSGWSMKILTVS